MERFMPTDSHNEQFVRKSDDAIVARKLQRDRVSTGTAMLAKAASRTPAGGS
jgi:hypothetical protein